MRWWEAAGLVTSVASLVVSAVALAFAWFAIRRSDRNASAGNLIALSEGLRQAWSRFLTAEVGSPQDYEFADLCNCLEIACAIYEDRAVHGIAKKVIYELLDSQLGMIDGDDGASERLAKLQEDASTFEYLRAFLRRVRRTVRLRPEIIT